MTVETVEAKPVKGTFLARLTGASGSGKVAGPGRLFLFFGVVLPVLAMLFECNFHYCAQHFFDPFPSPSHVVLFSLIPLSNFLAWLAVRRDLSHHYGFMSLISGMAVGIGCLYSLMFLPLSGLSAMFALAFGFGLLGLCPLLSLPCSWLSGKRVCQMATSKGTYFNAHQVEHIGHLIILVMVVAVELPSTLTRINLAQAANPDTAAEAVRWLREYGSQDVLLRACYERSGRATDILGSLYEAAHPVSVDAARTVFYRVTGKPFNSVPIPTGARATIQKSALISDPYGLNAGVEDEFDLDTDIAGQDVSSVARGLAVSQSEITAKLDPDALLGDLTWIFKFASKSKYDREARSKILLPDGAVVTKAVLTIGNVEHDATIMVRDAARAVYQRAIAERKKDPLLVSMCGVDEILVQCYPVPPDTPVKIALTMACPLGLDKNGDALLALPMFAERNFQVDAATSVNVQSPGPLSAVGMQLAASTTQAGLQQLQANLVAGRLNNSAEIICAQRDANCLKVYGFDTLQKSAPKSVVEMVVQLQHYQQPKKLFIVVDGSATMAASMPDIAAGLKALPADLQADLTQVSDGIVCLSHDSLVGSAAFSGAVDGLKKGKMAGGQDDSAAVIDALAKAVRVPGAAVLWIHGAQPLPSDAPRAIRELTGSTTVRPLLYDLPVAPGPNELLNGVDASSAIVKVSRVGSLKEDLAGLRASWQAGVIGQDKYKIYVESVPQAVLEGHQAGPSLAVLCAYQNLQRSLESHDPAVVAGAYKLASDYHLVTPVSSAVVSQPEPPSAPAAAAKKQFGAVGGSIDAVTQSCIDAPAPATPDLFAGEKSECKSGMLMRELGKLKSSQSFADDKEVAGAPACSPVRMNRQEAKTLNERDFDGSNAAPSSITAPALSGATNGIKSLTSSEEVEQNYRVDANESYEPLNRDVDIASAVQDLGTYIVSKPFMEQANTVLAIALCCIGLISLPGWLKRRRAPRRTRRLT